MSVKVIYSGVLVNIKQISGQTGIIDGLVIILRRSK